MLLRENKVIFSVFSAVATTMSKYWVKMEYVFFFTKHSTEKKIITLWSQTWIFVVGIVNPIIQSVWSGYCWPVPARWRRIQTSEKDFILVRFSFCRHSSAAPHFPLVPLSSPSRMQAGKQNNKKKNLLAGKVTSSYFQVHCAALSIIGQGFSVTAAGAPHWPCPAEQYSLVTATETDLLSVASHRITSPPPLSLLSSSPLSLHRFRLFIFNPADVPHAWRRRARNTDTVNQSGRGSWGGAELDWEKAPPTPEKKKGNMSPVTRRRVAQRRRKKPVGSVSENTICLVLIPRLFASASLPRPSPWKRNTPTRLSEQKGEELHINLTSLSSRAETSRTERRSRGDARRL